MQSNNGQTPVEPRAIPETNAAEPVVFTPTIIAPTGMAPARPVLTNAPATQAVSTAPLGFSQQDALEMERKKRRKKRLIIGLIVSVVVVVISVPFILYLLFSTSLKFKTVDYNNGEGSHFQLSYYSVYGTGKVYSSVSPENLAKGVNPSLQALYSRVDLHGKAPLRLFISSTALSAINQASYEKNKGCNQIPIAFIVHNDYANDDLNACVLRQGETDLLYFVSFKDAEKFYVISITQNADKKTDPIHLGLQDYQSDIEKIVTSIRVVK